jgi:hypothetical protein
MSLFSRPAWAQSQTTAKDTDDNIFSHSNRAYRDIVADKERKRKDKLERKKVKEERRSSGKREIKDEPGATEKLKRRRITLEDGEAILSSVGLSNPRHEDYDPVIIDDEEPVRRSPRISRHINIESPRKPTRPLRSTQAVEIGDDDEEEIRYEASEPVPEVVEVADDSDDEFAELARKARRERQQKELGNQRSRTPDIASHSPGPEIAPSSTLHRSLPTPPDPVVQIFVSSRIPNTNPLIVHRKLSQDLKDIRKVWCTKQQFSEEMTNRVFFVYRMRKVWDSITCRSLGLDVDAFGNITMKGADGKDGVDKVHLEAVTEEIFGEMKLEKEIEAKRRSGELPPEEDASAGAAEEAAAIQEKSATIKLILRAKGREDFKLIVKPVSASPPLDFGLGEQR